MRFLPKIYGTNFRKLLLTKILVLTILLITSTQLLGTTNETFNAGAYIINMGSTTQTEENGLMPYGLVYDLIVNENVPVRWAINPTKTKDGVDFTADGNSYKGGSFIIPVEYLSTDVLNVISTWQGDGVVVVGPTTNSFTAPIYTQLTSWPRAVLDEDNGGIVEDYYEDAGIPSSSYVLEGNPTFLTGCDDVYVLPHADPHDWDDDWGQALYDFVVNDQGYLWAACHAVSALETLVVLNSGDQCNFLSDTELIEWGEHDDGTLPYTYNDAYSGDPIMQFMGPLDEATENGSERIYIPSSGMSWRSSTKNAVYDPDHPENPSGDYASVLAYGHAFGNPNYGMVMYEAGHNHGGDDPDEIAAQRAYFNFVLMAGVDKQISVSSNVPTSVASGSTISISATGLNGTSPYIYEWSSSCTGGSFGNPTSATTTYTAPTVTTPTTCVITVMVTDDCGRFSFESTSVIVATATGPTAVNDNATIPNNTPTNINVLNNDIAGSTALDPTSVTFQGTLPNPATVGTFSVNPSSGLVTFTPVASFTGPVNIDYQVCDMNSLCDIATIYVVVSPPLSGPTAVNDNATTLMNAPVDIDVLSNDIQGATALNPASVSFVSGTAPNPTTQGTFTVNGTTGLVTFTPVNGYIGQVTIDYSVCDLSSLCDDATITVQVTPVTGPTANDDIAITIIDTPVNINVLSNDTQGTAAIDPTSVSFVTGTLPDPSTVGTFTVNATTGLVTFTPGDIFFGIATIDYEVCDLNSLCSIATITVVVSSDGDADGDGVPDIDDDYPIDPDRAFNNYYPAGGNGTLAYEDLWPSKGDYDFNDLVIDYRFMTVTNGSNYIVETFGTFTVKAIGAGFENGFGFQLANNNIADADILSVTGYDLQEGFINLEANGIEENQSIPTIIVYDNAFNVLEHPGSGTTGVNTVLAATYVIPETVNIYMAYNQDIYTLADLDIPNFNPFIIVDLNRGVEVHLPDYLPTDLADQDVFTTFDDDSDLISKYYKTVGNLPWAINIPVSFEYPIEKSDITTVYLKFAEWVESGGTLSQDWYSNESSEYRNSSLIYTHD